MKASQVISASALVAAASAATSYDASEIAFITALVGDLQANKNEYLMYVATALGIPAEVTTVALEVQQYTDTSYTTLLEQQNINVAEFQSFAQALPWYTRIEAAATAGAASGAASSTASSSEASSAVASQTASSVASSVAAAVSSGAAELSSAASSAAASITSAASSAASSGVSSASKAASSGASSASKAASSGASSASSGSSSAAASSTASSSTKNGAAAVIFDAKFLAVGSLIAALF